MARKRVILIDGTAIIFRAFFAIPGTFSTADGTPTNATYGFALMFRKLLAGRKADLGACVFDAPGRTFRDERFSEYKANRPPMRNEMRLQLPWIRRLVEAHDFPIITMPGYEADDVIGTLTRQSLEAGYEVQIISGDKDFAQLIGEHVRMIDTMKDVTYDAGLVRKKWGVGPDKFIDYLALVGDSSDNIPGVKGVGPKTAKKLLEQFGTLEGVLANTDQLKGKQRENLETFADDARLSKELATIDQHVPLEQAVTDLHLPEVTTSRVDAIYKELEFFSLLSNDGVAERLAGSDYEAFLDVEAARTFTTEIQQSQQHIAILPVIEGETPMNGEMMGVAVCAVPARGEDDVRVARYLPILGDGGLGEPARQLVLSWFAHPKMRKVGHDLRDLHCLAIRNDARVRGLVGDTRLASFLIDPTRDIPHRLDQLCKAWLHRPLLARKTLVGSGKTQVSLHDVGCDALTSYVCQRVQAVAELWPKLRDAVVDEGHIETLERVSLPMAAVLARMQVCGVRVDTEVLAGLSDEFEERKAAVEQEIYGLAGRSFNLASPKQLGTVLFDELGLPVIKRTKTGYSTAAPVLEKLKEKHAIAALIIDWRALAKLINTYTRVLREAVYDDGRVHCTFQQTAGASGRLITTNPDIQRTPIRTGDGRRIREAFVPRDGWRMISADWSQIELRILAHISQDSQLLRAYQAGNDLHAETAARLFGTAASTVNKEQRNVGKTVNFATVYGQGANALAQGLKIKSADAKHYIEEYFAYYSGVREWLDRTVRAAHADGFVETLLGRRRYIPELRSNNFADRAYGERIATNTPIQGSAADICKLAMLQIDEAIEDEDLSARMLLQIHDELVFEVPPDEVETLTEIVREAMENAFELSVPLVVDIGVGDSWAAAH